MAKPVNEAKPKQPPNTPFKQQTLKAWRPILTPKAVIITFLIAGAIFIPIGAIVLVTSSGVVEVTTIDYDKACCVSNCSSPVPGQQVDLNPCVISLNLTDDMEPPIYMYYQLTSFYQNHRQYVKSRDEEQLAGKSGLAPGYVKETCGHQYAAQNESAVGDSASADALENVISPCGLIAYSYFNDSFTLYESSPSGPKPVALDATSIAWPTDVSTKFFNAEDGSTGLNYRGFARERLGDGAADCTVLPDGTPPTSAQTAACTAAHSTAKFNPGWCYKDSGYCMEDQHFMVWMRTAGLPTFRKLFAKIDAPLSASKSYSVTIENGFEGLDPYTGEPHPALFPVHSFKGSKHIVLSTASWMGGKNNFLGMAYLGVGILCILFAAIFTVKGRFSQREFGKPHADLKKSHGTD